MTVMRLRWERVLGVRLQELPVAFSGEPQLWSNFPILQVLSCLEERLRLLGSPGPSTPPSSSLEPSTPISYSPGPSRSAPILEATLEMEIHPENHALDSAALLHELYNEMRKLGLE
ncbi:hypothetical protein Tco_1442533 [Tanacetum coccineum]